MNQEDKAKAWERMRAPTGAFVALMVLLAAIVLMGWLLPFGQVWIAEMLVLAAMVTVVLLVSMEVRKEPPLMRLFSAAGFVWVAILLGVTIVDYLSRP